MKVTYVWKKSSRKAYRLECEQSDVPLEGDLITGILLDDKDRESDNTSLRYRVKARQWFPQNPGRPYQSESSVILHVEPV